MSDLDDNTLDDDGALAAAAAGDDELALPADPAPGFGSDEDEEADD